jgi:catechol 2,3-dioxygenase-like lactoylglutathione lyase family enzyme
MYMSSASMDHIGITVTSLEPSLEFWTKLLSAVVVDRRKLESADIGRMLNCDGAVIDRALLESPFGFSLELLQYISHPDGLVQPRAPRPGTVHVCIVSDEFNQLWQQALSCGAVSVGKSPVSLSAPDGPEFKVGYLITPDGIMLEIKEGITG